MIDVERIAREAGFIWVDDYLVGGSLSAPQPDKPLLKYFAALVLEEAAKVCDEEADGHRQNQNGSSDGQYDWKEDCARDCATAIRALKGQQ